MRKQAEKFLVQQPMSYTNNIEMNRTEERNMSEKGITSKQMSEIDQYTINEIEIPSMVLMERASLGISQTLFNHTDSNSNILAVCGTGNNGADGVAVARMVSLQDRQVDILLIGDESKSSEEMKQQLAIARNIGTAIYKESNAINWKNYTVFVDALFGIGLNRDVEGTYREAINNINETQNSYVISVDIPSGLSGDTGDVMGVAVKANTTVTFGWQKTGLLTVKGKELSGDIITHDIGYPRDILKENNILK